MTNFELSAKIKDESNLAKLFNECMRKTDCLRIISSPSHITPAEMHKNIDNDPTKAIMFMSSCIYEIHFHTLINQLNERKNEIIRFENEFNYDFDRYAITNRLNLIKEYGGEDEDYNDDDTIKEATRKNMEDYSIVHELNRELHIFTDSTSDHFDIICNYLENVNNLSILKFFRKQGATILSSRIENGKMVKNTIEDEIEDEARTAYVCDSYSDLLKLVINHINILGILIAELPNDEKSIPSITEIGSYIDEILSLKIKRIPF